MTRMRRLRTLRTERLISSNIRSATWRLGALRRQFFGRTLGRGTLYSGDQMGVVKRVANPGVA
jgi:hypothetical protein